MCARNSPRETWPKLKWKRGPTASQGETAVAGETIVDHTIFLPGPTEDVEVDVATNVTVGVGIAMIMGAIGTDETVTAVIITTIVGTMTGVTMTAM